MSTSKTQAMRRVAGADLSLTSSGIAVITQRVDSSCIATATTITSRGRRADGLPERLARIARLAEEIDHAIGTAELVVLEAPSFGSKTASPVDGHHLWMSTAARLTTRGVPIALCVPATRAKAITGSGRADKAAVAAAVARLWPDLVLSNSDEADAVALAHLGAARLGWDVQVLQRHLDAMDAVRWPEPRAVAA